MAPEEWVPIIFLSASEDDQDLERAIECGGDDYLVKPVSTVVLNAKMRALQRLDQMRRKLVDLSNELTAANQRLETLSQQDGLTGIANRRAFDFLIERQFLDAERRREPFSVVLCDVDHFKAYNDRYGHLAGDECLRQVAAALAAQLQARHRRRGALRRRGVRAAAARHAGRGRAARRRGWRSASSLRSPSPTPPRPPRTLVTFSAGIATYVPERDKVSRDLTARADEALYRAKQLGRNRSVAV